MKNFLVTDKSGRSEKPYILSEEHIREFWDMKEQDNNETELDEFLDDAEIGDIWQTNSVEIKYINI